MTVETTSIAFIVPVIALAIALAAAAICFWRFRRLSHWVRWLAGGVEHLATGDLDRRIPVQGPAEARELAEALNHLTGTLGTSTRRLASERATLLAALETMADGMVVTDQYGAVLLLNQAAREMLNLGDQDPEGRRLIEIARDHQVHRLVSTCLSTGLAQSGPVELLRPRRYLSAVASPLPEVSQGPSFSPGPDRPLPEEQEGEISGALITLRDLTRSRQMEASHREFVSNVSHELRNPLASVKALVETLEDGAVEQPAVALDLLQRVHQDIDRMDNLVNDLLELSRLESGQLPLQLAPLDLLPVLDDVKCRFDQVAGERRIGVVLSLPKDLPRVMADKERLRQVLVNLLENAIKFTPPEGKVILSVQKQYAPQEDPQVPEGSQLSPGGVAEPAPGPTHPQPAVGAYSHRGNEAGGEGGFVEITVRDTGVGISQEDLPHIFDRFYKADRSRHAGGTGLGLAIVKQIVEAHNGAVWVNSQQGAGSTFAFTLPTAS